MLECSFPRRWNKVSSNPNASTAPTRALSAASNASPTSPPPCLPCPTRTPAPRLSQTPSVPAGHGTKREPVKHWTPYRRPREPPRKPSSSVIYEMGMGRSAAADFWRARPASNRWRPSSPVRDGGSSPRRAAIVLRVEAAKLASQPDGMSSYS